MSRLLQKPSKLAENLRRKQGTRDKYFTYLESDTLQKIIQSIKTYLRNKVMASTWVVHDFRTMIEGQRTWVLDVGSVERIRKIRLDFGATAY